MSFTVVTRAGTPLGEYSTRVDALTMASRNDEQYPDRAPHRIIEHDEHPESAPIAAPRGYGWLDNDDRLHAFTKNRSDAERGDGKDFWDSTFPESAPHVLVALVPVEPGVTSDPRIDAAKAAIERDLTEWKKLRDESPMNVRSKGYIVAASINGLEKILQLLNGNSTDKDKGR